MRMIMVMLAALVSLKMMLEFLVIMMVMMIVHTSGADPPSARKSVVGAPSRIVPVHRAYAGAYQVLFK